MKNCVACVLLLLVIATPALPTEPPSLRDACLATMMDLSGALRTLQVRDAGDPDFGAIRCPSCGIFHTRGAEAVYPFAVAYLTTGDTSYASAAITVAEWLFRWQKPGGEWDETPWTWTGTTADQLLMLGQAYPILKPRLSALQQARWELVMKRAADFLVRMMDPVFASINYCPTSAAALMVINGLVPDTAYVRKAHRLAHQVLAKMDEDGFIQGEAARAHGVKYGVDLGYEMDMSLWGLGLYARLNKDVVVERAVLRSLAKNLPFIYPNGAIDGSWGARCYKWTTYGSKTADGVQVLLSMYADRDPRYLTAAMRNLVYLRTMIHEGMVGNGPHFWEYFRTQVCIYPTFARAKTLAMAAMIGLQGKKPMPPLPSDRGNWLRVYPTVNVAVARSRHFMMTVSGYGYRDPSRTNDGQYNQHPTGGSVCNLWAEGAGFLTTSSQTRYVRGETIHMPVANDTAICLTPRIEYRDSLGYFTNLYEFEARQTTRSTRETTAVVTTTGELKDERWAPGGVAFSLTNALYDNGIVKTITLTFHDRTPTVRIVEPIVTDDRRRVTFDGPRRVLVHTPARTFAIDLLDGATTLAPDPASPFYSFPFPAMRTTPVVMLVAPPESGVVAVIRYRISIAGSPAGDVNEPHPCLRTRDVRAGVPDRRAAAPSSAHAGDDSLRAEIATAVRSCATYAATVLLDERGESRCEYNLLEGRWQSYEPAWHTGQIIAGLLEAYDLTKDTSYLAAARKAGTWWISLQMKEPPSLAGMLRAVHGAGVEYIIFATVSDGTPGLFELSRVTGDRRYASIATDAGRWMLEHMYHPEERIFYDAVDPVSGEVQTLRSPFWKEKSRQVLYDVARPNNEGSLFLDMFRFTGDSTYRRIFIGLCESLVEKQGPEGLWMQFTPNNRATGSFHPRFNLWYAESLINGYEETGRREFLDAAVKTLRWYTRFQRKDGTIFYDNNVNGSSIESSPSGSTVAFAGLLWLRLLQHGVGAEFAPNYERSFRWIMRSRFSVHHPDANLAGGVYNLRARGKGDGMAVVQRDLGTSFGLRFLAAYYRHTLSHK